jgi:D-arabinitol dehydrogenase (NADP+)
MRALNIVEPGRAVVLEMKRPEPGPGEVLIEVMACGICGTDIHIFRGEYIGAYPIIPGHEFSGIVEEVGEGVTRFKRGDHVAVEPNIACNNCYNCLHNRQNFCLNWEAVGVTRPGAMAHYVLAPEENTFDIGSLPFEAGALMEPLSCIIHGLQELDISLADRIAVLGAGPIGLLMIQLIRHMGAVEVIAVDRNRARLDAAARYGASPTVTDVNLLKPDGYDVVVDATGVVEVMSKTLDFVRPGGSVLLFGVPPKGKPMQIEPFTMFRKGLSIFSSFTSVRNSYQAVSLLQSGIIDFGGIISHSLSLDEFQHGVEIIEKGAEQVKKVMIIPNRGARSDVNTFDSSAPGVDN